MGLISERALMIVNESIAGPTPSARQKQETRLLRAILGIAGGCLLLLSVAQAAESSTASNSFTFVLSQPVTPGALLADSPFGINTAFHPSTPDLEARLAAMQQAGIKWGR